MHQFDPINIYTHSFNFQTNQTQIIIKLFLFDYHIMLTSLFKLT